MNRFFLLFPLLFIGWNAQAQLEKIKFSTQLTKRHINMKGTRVSIIMPEDWDKSEGITGVTNNEGINVIFIEAGQSFEKYKKMSLENIKKEFSTNGTKVNKVIRLKNEKYNPIALEIINSSKVPLIQLMLGDKSFVLSVTGSYQNEQEKKELISFLSSAYIDSSKKIDAKSVAKFTLDLSNTDLESKGYNGFAFMYQTKNIAKRPKNEREAIIVFQFSASLLDGESLEEICKSQIKKDTKNQQIISEGSVKTKVGKGYRVIAKGKTQKNINYWLATRSKETILFIRASSLKAEKQAIQSFDDLLLKNLKLK